MFLEISYATAKKRYPKHVAEVLKKLQDGRSKHKATPPQLMQWGFNWCIQIGGPNDKRGPGLVNIVEMLARRQKPEPEWKPANEQEAIEDYAGRASIHLVGRIGKSSWYSETAVPPLPKEMEEMVRKNFRSEKAEKARWDAMPAGKRDEELGKILGELRGSPGFVEIRMPDFGQQL